MTCDDILLLQGEHGSGTCCRFEWLSLTLMKIATSSISSSVFLGDSRVLQLSGSITRHTASIGGVPLTVQQLHINATVNDSLLQTHISFIAASPAPVSPLAPSSVMALTGGSVRACACMCVCKRVHMSRMCVRPVVIHTPSTEHSGGGRVSLVNDTDGSTAWTLPTSSRQDCAS